MELAPSCSWQSKSPEVMTWRFAVGDSLTRGPGGRDLRAGIHRGGRRKPAHRTSHVSRVYRDLFLIAPWEINDLGCQDGTTRWIVAFETDSLLGAPEDLFLAAGKMDKMQIDKMMSGWPAVRCRPGATKRAQTSSPSTLLTIS